ncbi:MAG: hypothetical protein IJP31_07115 [Lachnospiraceae bacterium]|nr:hypothetical protein [Lachnospiraceae bacterium]
MMKKIAAFLLCLCLLGNMGITALAAEGPDEGYLEYADYAAEELALLAEEKDMLAIVYMTNSYSVKSGAGIQTETVASLTTAHTVQVLGMEVEWVWMEEWEEYLPRVWYRVQFYQGDELFSGYIEESYLAYSDEELIQWKQQYFSLFPGDNVSLLSEETDYSDVRQFPTSYQVYLKKLKDAHPNWIFVPMNINRDWETCVREQLGSYSWIYRTQPAQYRGSKINSSWYYASYEGISYYMDPRNFLTEKNIFQFEQNTYNASYHTQEALQSFLSNTFMSGIIPGDSEGRTYAYTLWASGKDRMLSPFNLAARVIQEQGVQGNSAMISGTYSGFEGYYNYYNISANGTTNAEVLKNGLTYAKKAGWNTRYKSLYEGAAFIGNNYILRGQDTLYLQKFDVEKSRGDLHQYMQNIMAPYTEGRSMQSMYASAGSLDSAFVFKIPVFKNMPGANYTMTPATLSLEKGKTAALSLKCNDVVVAQPQDVVSFSTDNPKVAEVSADGVITAKGSGETVVRAVIQTGDGQIELTAKVSVYAPLQGIQLNQQEAELYVETELTEQEAVLTEEGKTEYLDKEDCPAETVLQVLYKPEDTTDDRSVKWTVEDETILTLKEDESDPSRAIIRAKAGGTTIVTAQVGKYSAKCRVTVRIPVEQVSFSVTFKAEDGSDLLTAKGTYGQSLEHLEAGQEEISWTLHKEGSVFLGWYTKENGQGDAVTAETILYGDLTVYPYFIEEKKEDEEEEFVVKPLGSFSYTGADLEPEVEVYDGNTKLTEGVDYTLSYANNRNVSIEAGEDKQPQVIVKGRGSYNETVIQTFTILPRDIGHKEISVSDLVTVYTGKIQKLKPEIKDNNRTLQLNQDYILEYPQEEDGVYLESGTYEILIRGTGNYSGSRSAYLTISKRVSLSSVTVEKFSDMTYAGGEECRQALVLVYEGKTLVEGQDYSVSYSNNREAGKATVTITGQGSYQGSITRTFNILPYDMEANSLTWQSEEGKEEPALSLSGEKITLVYDKDGVKPQVTLSFKGEPLTAGKDYQLSWKNHTAVGNPESKNPPTIVITGKGNFEGTLTRTFTILTKDIARINITAKDVKFKNRTGFCFVEPVLKDSSGRTLKAGTDYQAELLYTYETDVVLQNGVVRRAGDVVEKNDIPTPGEKKDARIRITVQGMGNYSGTTYCTYAVLESSSWIDEVTNSFSQSTPLPDSSGGNKVETEKDATENRSDNETGKPANSEAGKQTESEAGKPANSDAGKPAESEAGRQTNSDAGKQTNSEAGKQTDGETGKPAESEAGKQTDSEAGRKPEAQQEAVTEVKQGASNTIGTQTGGYTGGTEQETIEESGNGSSQAESPDRKEDTVNFSKEEQAETGEGYTVVGTMLGSCLSSILSRAVEELYSVLN